jgi:hypothetical protein
MVSVDAATPAEPIASPAPVTVEIPPELPRAPARVASPAPATTKAEIQGPSPDLASHVAAAAVEMAHTTLARSAPDPSRVAEAVRSVARPAAPRAVVAAAPPRVAAAPDEPSAEPVPVAAPDAAPVVTDDAPRPAQEVPVIVVAAPAHADAPVTRPEGAPAAIARPAEPSPSVVHHAPERLREAALASADAHALRRGVHAEVDLGDAGRVAVTARQPHGATDVRVDAESSRTATVLVEHASELVADLQKHAPDARVTIGGPTTLQSFGNGSSGGGGRPRDEAPAPAEPEEDARVPVPGRRVRFVL